MKKPIPDRVDRLERIAGLFVRAGLKMRADLRELDEKFKMIANMQMENMEMFLRNEERFAQNERRFARNEERFAKYERRFALSEERLVKLSENTDRRFAELAVAQSLSNEQIAKLAESHAELIKVIRKDQRNN